MDRPIRPLFPAGFIDEVQIQSMVLSSDRQTDPDILAMNSASAALSISSLPFQGPIGSIRMGLIDGQFVVMPSYEQLEESELDLIVSGSKDAVLMIEGFARELPEDKMAEAIMEAHRVIRELCDMQIELAQKVGTVKNEFVPAPNDGIYDKLIANYTAAYGTAKYTEGKQARAKAVKAVKEQAKAAIIPDPKAEGALTDGQFNNAWSRFEERVIRDLILSGKRPDGRDNKTLRQLTCLVDVLPRVHGSAVFQRGETQALVTIVLGTGKDEQKVDGLMDEYSKKFMLDYNFPPFSVGETKPIRAPGRREIGHGCWPNGA